MVDAERRTLLDNFAKLRGFDPLVPSYWHQVNTNELRKVKVN